MVQLDNEAVVGRRSLINYNDHIDDLIVCVYQTAAFKADVFDTFWLHVSAKQTSCSLVYRSVQTDTVYKTVCLSIPLTQW